MNNQNDSDASPPVVAGIAWYTPEEWDSIREQVADPETFDYTYNEWLANAQKTVSELRSAGTKAYRIPFHLDDFLRWCRANAKQPNSEARSEYTSAETERIHG